MDQVHHGVQSRNKDRLLKMFFLSFFDLFNIYDSVDGTGLGFRSIISDEGSLRYSITVCFTCCFESKQMYKV